MTFIESESDEAQPEGFRKEMKRLKAENKELRSAADELAQLKQERIFVQAGVALSDERAPIFIAGYPATGGEMTPEAIRASWTKFGGHHIEGHGQEQNPQMADELAQLGRIAEATSGGASIPADRFKERDQKLASLNQNDPRLDEKYNAIIEEYGGRTGSMVG